MLANFGPHCTKVDTTQNNNSGTSKEAVAATYSGRGERDMKFRKKPVVIDVMQIGNGGWPEPFWNAVNENRIILHLDTVNRKTVGYVDIVTLEGVMRGEVGDWIIKGVKGEFYPCKPDIFAATYEPIEQAGRHDPPEGREP